MRGTGLWAYTSEAGMKPEDIGLPATLYGYPIIVDPSMKLLSSKDIEFAPWPAQEVALRENEDGTWSFVEETT